jgi:hypothetical protein
MSNSEHSPFLLPSVAIGEQTDLKSDDIVTDETNAGREERNAASESQSADTNTSRPAASDSNSERIELGVHVCPSVAWSYCYRGVVARRCDLVELTQIDRYTLIDICGSGERGVS